jgi:hypothetical protein
VEVRRICSITSKINKINPVMRKIEIKPWVSSKAVKPLYARRSRRSSKRVLFPTVITKSSSTSTANTTTPPRCSARSLLWCILPTITTHTRQYVLHLYLHLLCATHLLPPHSRRAMRTCLLLRLARCTWRRALGV